MFTFEFWPLNMDYNANLLWEIQHCKISCFEQGTLIIINISTRFQVLFGQIRIHSYTAKSIDSDKKNSSSERYTVLCERSEDFVLHSNDKPICLTPYINNIHEIIAETDVAFFDCLIPPYKEKCNFYICKGVRDKQKNLYELLCVGSEPEISYYTVARTYSGRNFTHQS